MIQDKIEKKYPTSRSEMNNIQLESYTFSTFKRQIIREHISVVIITNRLKFTYLSVAFQENKLYSMLPSSV